MLIALCAAYFIPFELVLLSYAFLGPAHYLTEISWLHDRDYFVGRKAILIPMVAVTLLLSLFMMVGFGSMLIYYMGLGIAIALAFGFLYGKKAETGFLVFFAVVAVLTVIQYIFPPAVMGLVFLLPTVIHVYVFTGLFILWGAIKSKSLWGYASFVIFCACGLAFFFLEPSTNVISSDFLTKNIGFFNDLTDYISSVLTFNGNVNTHTLFAFLSFAYTYHYLNWFSKVEVIKWNKIPRDRAIIIAVVYFVSIGLYLYDYKVGFAALTALSIGHVLLEFPLNILSVRGIGSHIFASKPPSY